MEDNLRHRTSLLSSLHAVKGIFPQRFCSNEVRSDLVFPFAFSLSPPSLCSQLFIFPGLAFVAYWGIFLFGCDRYVQ